MNQDTYFDGFWQNEKYFKEFDTELQSIFSMKGRLSTSSIVYEEQIKESNSVSLHVRRGDYVTSKLTNEIHGTCSLDYYQKAVSMIESKIKNPVFYLFSDDIPWVKDNFSFIENKKFIQLDDETPPHDEIHLMSLCDHNIIANSSFSWWGAWLNNNKEKIVIAPFKWFNDKSFDVTDLNPKSWLCL